MRAAGYHGYLGSPMRGAAVAPGSPMRGHHGFAGQPMGAAGVYGSPQHRVGAGANNNARPLGSGPGGPLGGPYHGHSLHAHHAAEGQGGSDGNNGVYSEDAVAAAVRASVAEAEARKLAKANAVLVRQHVSSKLHRLPPAGRDPTGAREYQLETAFVDERNEFARILADLEKELEEVKSRQARYAGEGGDAALRARVAELEEAHAHAEHAIAALRHERNLALQQTDLWSSSARRMAQIVNDAPRANAAGNALAAARGPAGASASRLALENEALRAKIAHARAAADAREYEIAKEREVRLATAGNYPDREVDVLKIQNANLVRDLKTLAHDNVRTKRRYKLAKREQELLQAELNRAAPAPVVSGQPIASAPAPPPQAPFHHPAPYAPRPYSLAPHHPPPPPHHTPWAGGGRVPGVVSVRGSLHSAPSSLHHPPYPPQAHHAQYAPPPPPPGMPTRIPGVVLM